MKKQWQTITITSVLGCCVMVMAASKDLGKIMPFGDSITAGKYRLYLYQDLTNAGYSFQFIGSQTDANAVLSSATPAQNRHEGHGGYTILDLETNIDSLNDNTSGYPSSTNNGGYWFPGIPSGPNARAPAYPDFILVQAGTNDISEHETAQECINNLRRLLVRIVTDRPDARVLVASIVPRIDSIATWGPYESVGAAYGAMIPALLAESAFRGKHLTFVDMHAALSGPGDIGDDGLHPSNAGYSKMAATWMQAIVAIANPTSVTLMNSTSGRASATKRGVALRVLPLREQCGNVRVWDLQGRAISSSTRLDAGVRLCRMFADAGR
jgi:hypothetical protein